MTTSAFAGMELAAALSAVYGAVPARHTLKPLKGGASTRRYYRLEAPGLDPASLVVMRLPTEDVGKPSGSLPFPRTQALLSERGIPVPGILVDDSERGVLLLEDLGDETFAARLERLPQSEWTGCYERAVAVLAQMHAVCGDLDQQTLPSGQCFDRALLHWELEHFREWGLLARGCALAESDAEMLSALFASLVERIVELPQGFAHKDYQSRNLMWRGDSLVVLDFQDALRGPLVYDLVALLCDSYVELEEPLQQHLLAHYAALRGLAVEPLTRAFWLVCVQRKLKDAGRFVFFDQVRGSPELLRWYGPSLRQVARALSHLPELAALRELLSRTIVGFPHAIETPREQTGARA